MLSYHHNNNVLWACSAYILHMLWSKSICDNNGRASFSWVSISKPDRITIIYPRNHNLFVHEKCLMFFDAAFCAAERKYIRRK